MSASTPAPDAARTLVQALAALGVREAVLAPGSRSAPLAYALAAAALPADAADRPAGAPQIALHVRVDERSAAFLALGIAKTAALTGAARPVVVVTTSGTATANLHPAVLEAHHSGVPLLLLTADRPQEMRDSGANQTTRQVGIYADAVRWEMDVPAPSGRPGEAADLRAIASRAVAAALGATGGAPGPVHLNLCYREPLVPGDAPWPDVADERGLTRVAPRPRAEVSALREDAPGAGVAAAVAKDDPPAVRGHARRHGGHARRGGRRRELPTVVVAGDGAGARARGLAEERGWPLVAEPSSGSRGGPNAVTAPAVVLGAGRPVGLVEEVRRVVVLGRPTLSRPVQALLARDDVEVVVVAPGAGQWHDPSRRADAVLASTADLSGEGEPEWLEAWQTESNAVGAHVEEILDAEHAPGRRSRGNARMSGPALARLVAKASSPVDVLLVGASNPIRDLDLVAAWEEPPLVLANRGLAGIDGTVSTAIGVAHALPGRQVRALVGDLTFLHDVGGMLHGPAEPAVDLQIVVANDEGGSIFATLEHGAPEHAATFERVFATPHQADLAALCAGYGVRHTLARDPEELRVALAKPGPGLTVLEVRIDRARRRRLDATLRR